MRDRCCEHASSGPLRPTSLERTSEHSSRGQREWCLGASGPLLQSGVVPPRRSRGANRCVTHLAFRKRARQPRHCVLLRKGASHVCPGRRARSGPPKRAVDVHPL
jgi:hypothetical protein